MAHCALCGAAHAACGPVTTVVPIGENAIRRKEDWNVGLKRYDVDLGKGRTTVMLLSDEDAKRYGSRAKPAGKTAPANKARGASTKAATDRTPPSAA